VNEVVIRLSRSPRRAWHRFWHSRPKAGVIWLVGERRWTRGRSSKKKRGVVSTIERSAVLYSCPNQFQSCIPRVTDYNELGFFPTLLLLVSLRGNFFECVIHEQWWEFAVRENCVTERRAWSDFQNSWNCATESSIETWSRWAGKHFQVFLMKSNSCVGLRCESLQIKSCCSLRWPKRIVDSTPNYGRSIHGTNLYCNVVSSSISAHHCHPSSINALYHTFTPFVCFSSSSVEIVFT
jgi:hypothetical protein